MTDQAALLAPAPEDGGYQQAADRAYQVFPQRTGSEARERALVPQRSTRRPGPILPRIAPRFTAFVDAEETSARIASSILTPGSPTIVAVANVLRKTPQAGQQRADPRQLPIPKRERWSAAGKR